MSPTYHSTPRKSLVRPRPSPSNGINTASSPNLNASYTALQLSGLGTRTSNALARKSSLNALTSGSLATIPDASKGYGLSTVMDEDSLLAGSMPPITPSRDAGRDGLEVGDRVDVPGNMHGTVKFIGSVNGKKGVFAGVELSEEYAARGKNNGDVDGVSYFTTSLAGAGIFLPIARAIRRGSPSSHDDSILLTPTTPSVGAKGSHAYTPPTPGFPKFSQSVGPGRAPSPQFKKTSRPSLPRPESPLRKPQLIGRPSIGTPVPKPPSRYGSPVPNKFGQSVRGTQDSRDPRRDPSKKSGLTSRNGMKASVGPRSASALGQTPLVNSDDDTTPIGAVRPAPKGSLSSVSSFKVNGRPASRAATDRYDEVDRLRGQLEERDKQLKEQASSLAEMESSLAEVQSLMGSDSGRRGSMEDKDAPHLRALLREKNDKIAMLTAEFDAHRADFRSTIDTLELASTETERVYEHRVNELIQEVKELHERGEDVESVARQLKQLEELVQELEEGLEDARRGEAEARGEVEFLRGEVERTRSELRREREKAAASMNGNGNSNRDAGALSKDIEQRDDEIRGLKAIIHSLSRDAVPDSQRTPTQHRRPSDAFDSIDERLDREKAERETNAHLDSGNAIPATQRSSAITVNSSTTAIQDRNSTRDSKSTVSSWRDRASPETHRRGNPLETMPESDTYSSANESFCELCETAGHDILTCTNMFSGDGQTPSVSAPAPANGNTTTNNNHHPHLRTGKDVLKAAGLSPKHDDYKPAPLSPSKRSKSPLPSPPITTVRIIPNPMESGPVAGKESGVVNMDKWCGVCEREGHDSIDCPFEDAF